MGGDSLGDALKLASEGVAHAHALEKERQVCHRGHGHGCLCRELRRVEVDIPEEDQKWCKGTTHEMPNDAVERLLGVGDHVVEHTQQILRHLDGLCAHRCARATQEDGEVTMLKVYHCHTKVNLTNALRIEERLFGKSGGLENLVVRRQIYSILRP